jgi:hypothetical protein
VTGILSGLSAFVSRGGKGFACTGSVLVTWHGKRASRGHVIEACGIVGFNAPNDDMRDSQGAAARVKVVRVEPASSRVEVADARQLDPTTAYKAVVVALPLPWITVVIKPREGPDAETGSDRA